MYSDDSLLVRNRAVQTLAVLCETAGRHAAAVDKVAAAYACLEARHGYRSQLVATKKAASHTQQNTCTVVEAAGVEEEASQGFALSVEEKERERAARKAQKASAIASANNASTNATVFGGSGDGPELLRPTDGSVRVALLPGAAVDGMTNADGTEGSSSSLPSFVDSAAVAASVTDRLWREVFSATGAHAGIHNAAASMHGSSRGLIARAALGDCASVTLSSQNHQGQEEKEKGVAFASSLSVIPIARGDEIYSPDMGADGAVAENAPLGVSSSASAADASSSPSSSSSSLQWYSVSFSPPLLARADLHTVWDSLSYAFGCPKATHLPRNVLSPAVLAAAATRDAIVARLLKDGSFGNPADGDDNSIATTTATTASAVAAVDADVAAADLGKFGAYRVNRLPEDGSGLTLPAASASKGGGGNNTIDGGDGGSAVASSAAASATNSAPATKGVPSFVILPTHVASSGSGSGGGGGGIPSAAASSSPPALLGVGSGGGVEAVFAPSTTPYTLRAAAIAALMLPSDDHFMFITNYSRPASFVNAVFSSPSSMMMRGGAGAGHQQSRFGAAHSSPLHNNSNSNGPFDPLFGPIAAATGAATAIGSASPQQIGIGGGPYATLPRIPAATSTNSANNNSSGVSLESLAEACEEGLSALLMTWAHAAMSTCRDARDRIAGVAVCALLLTAAGGGVYAAPAAATTATIVVDALPPSPNGLALADPQRIVALLRCLLSLVASDSVFAVRARAAAVLGQLSPSVVAAVGRIEAAEAEAVARARGNQAAHGVDSQAFGIATRGSPLPPAGFASGGAVRRSPVLGPAAAPTFGAAVSSFASSSAAHSSTVAALTPPPPPSPSLPTSAVILSALCGALAACGTAETFAQFRDADLLRSGLCSAIRALVRGAPPSAAFQQALSTHYTMLEHEGLL